MNAAESLRHAADVVDESGIGERKSRIIRLISLYVIRACGEGENAEEARLLMELLNQ